MPQSGSDVPENSPPLTGALEELGGPQVVSPGDDSPQRLGVAMRQMRPSLDRPQDPHVQRAAAVERLGNVRAAGMLHDGAARECGEDFGIRQLEGVDFERCHDALEEERERRRRRRRADHLFCRVWFAHFGQLETLRSACSEHRGKIDPGPVLIFFFLQNQIAFTI
jgi:hypothetical protein